MSRETEQSLSEALTIIEGLDTECHKLREALECAEDALANLSLADLSGADLSGAKLQDESKTVGERPIFQFGPLGSRCAYLVAFLTDKGVRIQAGCFFGPLSEFRAKVKATHGATVHGKEYAAAIKMIEAHARLWTPKKGGA